jgi:predicted nucleotidyltransferase
LSTVSVKSVDGEAVRKAVAAYAAQLRRQHPEVERLIWFGSWVNGLPSPGSDVDLCLVVSSADKSPRDRVSEYLPLGFPVGVDLCVYTRSEFEQLPTRSPGWYQAITSGIEI